MWLSAKENLRLLFVDDDENDLYFVSRALVDNGYTHPILHFWNGMEAQSYLQSHTELSLCERPNIILIDYHLPGINGLELMLWIQSQPTLQHIPLLMLSSTRVPVGLQNMPGSFNIIPKTLHLDNLILALDHYVRTGRLEAVAGGTPKVLEESDPHWQLEEI